LTWDDGIGVKEVRRSRILTKQSEVFYTVLSECDSTERPIGSESSKPYLINFDA